MMKLMSGKKSKNTQYAVGGVIALVIVFGWLSLPLMQKSSFDTSVPSSNPFKSKVVDLNSMEIPQEGSAPGYALSGAMTDNPATSGDLTASSLFSSGMGELSSDEAGLTDGASASASASASAGGPVAPPAPSAGGSRPKMSAPGSMSGGGGNSRTAGGMHNKFFGGANAKAELAPSQLPSLKKPSLSEKPTGLMASLASVEKKSLSSAGMKVEQSRGGSAGAFDRTAAPSKAGLTEDMERDSAVAGLELGKVDADLKKNDPSINKKKIKMPDVKDLKEAEDNDEMYKQMIMQMIISQVVGPMFGSLMGGMTGGGSSTSGNVNLAGK